MVASGTRNAAAISAVVRPPTARRVSASCDGGDSDGWQQRNSRVRVSSCSLTGAGSACQQRVVSSRPAAGALAAELVDQPAARPPRPARTADCPGRPRPATAAAAGEQRLLHRVLGRVELPVPPDQHPEDLRRQLAQQARSITCSGGPSGTSRSSTRSAQTTTCDGQLDRPRLVRDVEHPEPGQRLLGLGERPVGDHHLAVDQAHRLGRAREGQAARRRPVRRSSPARRRSGP